MTKQWTTREDKYGMVVCNDDSGVFTEIIEIVAAEMGFTTASHAMLRKLLDKYHSAIEANLKRGRRVQIPNFGVYAPYYRVYDKGSSVWTVRFRGREDFRKELMNGMKGELSQSGQMSRIVRKAYRARRHRYKRPEIVDVPDGGRF